MALKRELADALEHIANICGWENIEGLWRDTGGFKELDDFGSLCRYNDDLERLWQNFTLLKDFNDPNSEILNYIENVRKTRATVLDDTELTLIHTFRKLSSERQGIILRSVFKYFNEEGDNYDVSIITLHNIKHSDEDIAETLDISVDKVKEVLLSDEYSETREKITKTMKAIDAINKLTVRD